MPDETASLNIYEKLLEIRKSCSYLKKESQGYAYQYVSSSQTLGALREKMDEQRLLLIPRIVNHNVFEYQTAKGKHEFFTELEIEYTWVNVDNPEETIVCMFYAQGSDDFEKGPGKALTYGEKFFLLKFFNIATDKDDPDAHQNKPSTTSGKKAGKQNKPPNEPVKDPVTESQRKKIYAKMKEFGVVDPGAIKIVLGHMINRSVESSRDITKEEGSRIINILDDPKAVENFITIKDKPDKE